MFKDTKLPKLLWEFIDSSKHRLEVETEAECVESVVELVWTDWLIPKYTHITFYVVGAKKSSLWKELENKLNDAKSDALFDCVPAPYVTVEYG